MRSKYYGDLYRRYQTYIRQYNPDRKFKKIACGANNNDYHWTEEVLKTCFDHSPEHEHGFMDLISLHYYDMPYGWDPKVSATKFDDECYYRTLNKAYVMDEYVSRHCDILDQYDPDKKIGLAVDEWGTWFEVEPGTNPGFLYQQNTIRDALVAGITLNIFNKHCDRVKMACIAQMVNVLQSVILTDGEKMIKTPTSHVFHMYRHHQGAELLGSSITGATEIGVEDGFKVPDLTESVSEKDGIITITVSNQSLTDAKELDVIFAEKKSFEIVEAKLVGGADPHDHNTFEDPEKVVEKDFEDYKTDGGLKLNVPAASVVEIRLK